MSTKIVDRTNIKIHHLTFIHLIGNAKAGKGAEWLLECDCGRRVVREGNQIAKGKIYTCGHPKCMYYRQLRTKPRGPATRRKYKTSPLDGNHYAKYLRRRKGAQERNIEWSLTDIEYIQTITEPCHYCGTYGLPDEGVGIHRVNSDKGYSIKNCVPCCPMCNIMKRHHSYDTFIDHITTILTHLRKLNPH